MKDKLLIGAEKQSHCGEDYTTKKFESVPMELATIDGRAARWINALILNGETFGGGGAQHDDSLILSKGEYISYLKVSWLKGLYAFITEIKIETTSTNGKAPKKWILTGEESQKHTSEPTYVRSFGISQFGDKANEFDKSNVSVISEGKTAVRILSLSGYYRSDALESLDVRYLDPYIMPKDQEDVELDEVLYGIMDIYNEGMTISNSDSAKYRQLNSLKLISEFTVTAETEIKAQYMMAEATSRFGIGYMNRQELDSQIEVEKSIMTSSETKIESGVYGLLQAPLTVRKNKEDGTFLLIPETGASLITIKAQNLKTLSFIDFRQKVPLLGEGLKMTERYGWKNYHKAEK